MQDLQSMGAGADRIFSAGERRVRPNYQNEDMKCPRCESPNTKFCYYNNYNLSQPRHYCRGCRRHWTKGGVLRNVPVGGGCRKTKKLKPKPSPETAQAELKSKSNSSSENSSLTATPPPTTISSSRGTAAVTDSGSVTDLSYIMPAFKLPESRFFVSPQTTATKPNFEQNPSEQDTLPEIRNFTSLMNDSSILNFSNNPSENSSSLRLNQQQQLRQDQQQWQLPKITTSINDDDDDHLNMQQIATGFLDQTVHVDLSTRSGTINGGDFPTIDWLANGGDNQGLFQFTAGTVDHGYWSQNQWSDHDHSLY